MGEPKLHVLRRRPKAERHRKRQRFVSALPESLVCVVSLGLLRVLRLAMLNRAELMALHGRREPENEVLARPASGRSEMAALRALMELLRGAILGAFLVTWVLSLLGS